MSDAMSSKLMEGRELARRVLAGAADKVARIRTTTGVTAGLATVLVGNDPASVTYTRMKRKRCTEAGMTPTRIELPGDASTAAVVSAVRELGGDPAIHGILVQHPVPRPIDKRAVFEAIPVAKDVDGVTSAALGKTILGMTAHGACTPVGIMRLLREYAIDLDGAYAVVIGRSPILGRPMASLLINAHATVTLCHSRTRALPTIVRGADLIIAAVGKPRFVQGDWVKPGAVVVDAGYNPGNIGDVDFDAILPACRLITPVPGGVGPMTIATLIDQTADAAAEQLGVELDAAGQSRN
jgi:methylenetetrahydrofolate dehydrogenase (NADP+)/methenyltetrahydrofolate cyclohydrolase